MLPKKLFVGATVVALVLSTSVVASATSSQKGIPLDGTQYQKTISMGGEGGFSFDEIDKDNLPDGVQYQAEISMSGEGAISLK